MPVTSDKSAPYAPASAIIELIERYRNRGLQAPVTADVLQRAGISESLISRTLQALQVLDLVDEKGMPSKILEGIRLAPEVEHKQRMSEWLQSAYADVFSFVDPAVDDEIKIRDAFRTYHPVAQQPRMITLFIGLLSAAGMLPEKNGGLPRHSRPQSTKTAGTRNAPTPGGRARVDVQKDERGSPLTPLPPQQPPRSQEISEKALEYRLVDLMSEAASDPDVMAAIIKVITFLKTKNVKDSAT